MSTSFGEFLQRITPSQRLLSSRNQKKNTASKLSDPPSLSFSLSLVLSSSSGSPLKRRSGSPGSPLQDGAGSLSSPSAHGSANKTAHGGKTTTLVWVAKWSSTLSPLSICLSVPQPPTLHPPHPHPLRTSLVGHLLWVST